MVKEVKKESRHDAVEGEGRSHEPTRSTREKNEEDLGLEKRNEPSRSPGLDVQFCAVIAHENRRATPQHSHVPSRARCQQGGQRRSELERSMLQPAMSVLTQSCTQSSKMPTRRP